jgi:hypothetical protein
MLCPAENSRLDASAGPASPFGPLLTSRGLPVPAAGFRPPGTTGAAPQSALGCRRAAANVAPARPGDIPGRGFAVRQLAGGAVPALRLPAFAPFPGLHLALLIRIGTPVASWRHLPPGRPVTPGGERDSSCARLQAWTGHARACGVEFW